MKIQMPNGPREEFTQAILSAMTWLDLDWDEGPIFQRLRKKIHLEYIQKLLDSGQAYYCHCTPDELTVRRQKAMAEGRKPKYDGLCREKGLGPAPGAVVRFKGPLSGVTHWNDLIKGPIAFNNDELDDLVILKSDGMPTYNMAVVVDDITMDINPYCQGRRPCQQHASPDTALSGLERPPAPICPRSHDSWFRQNQTLQTAMGPLR